jgi:hypothetical protein
VLHDTSCFVRVVILMAGIAMTTTTWAQAPDAQMPRRLHWQFKPRPVNQWVLPAAQLHPMGTQLSQAEMLLYGKSYADHSVPARINRLERSLNLTDTVNLNRQERIQRVITRIQQGQAHRSPDRFADIGLLEMRLFRVQRPDWPMLRRLSALEAATYGQVFPDDTETQRLHRLYEQIPIHSRSIQVNAPAEPPYSAVPYPALPTDPQSSLP